MTFNKIVGIHYSCPECGYGFVYTSTGDATLCCDEHICVEDGYRMKKQFIYEQCEIEKTYKSCFKEEEKL